MGGAQSDGGHNRRRPTSCAEVGRGRRARSSTRAVQGASAAPAHGGGEGSASSIACHCCVNGEPTSCTHRRRSRHSRARTQTRVYVTRGRRRRGLSQGRAGAGWGTGEQARKGWEGKQAGAAARNTGLSVASGRAPAGTPGGQWREATWVSGEGGREGRGRQKVKASLLPLHAHTAGQDHRNGLASRLGVWVCVCVLRAGSRARAHGRRARGSWPCRARQA